MSFCFIVYIISALKLLVFGSQLFSCVTCALHTCRVVIVISMSQKGMS